MKIRKKRTIFLFLIGSLLSYFTANAQQQKVKNIILLIGDGMGIAQTYAGMVGSSTALNLERCKTIGFSKTYSANDFTTDSSAGGTAIACGVKTNNGMVGMSPDSLAKPSIMQIAHDKGLATGLAVTCNVTHATPASFVAHQPNRNMSEEIAADYLKAGIDVFIGGGKNDFEKRKDGRNLSRELQEKGYTVTYTLESMNRVQNGKLAALLADNHLGRASERDNMLEKSVYKALHLLSQNEKGFFLLVEASQIDWAAHQNQSNYMTEEVRDFDRAIGVALDFSDRNEGTLVIVTADHETGGLTLPKGDIAARKFKADFDTLHHTGVPVPIYTYGTGSENFGGFMQNTDIFNRMLQAFDFEQ